MDLHGAIIKAGKKKLIRIESLSPNKLTFTIPQGEILGNVLDFLPYGIVDKTVTGIGATTLEILSKRNSIIVMPTRILAYNKSKYKDGLLYVGGEIAEFNQKKVTKKQIKNYISNSNIEYKKILVVSDSLPAVLEVIGNTVYENYFLMIDEVDIIQTDSVFRPALEKSIDYYFKFNPQKRCAVSATINHFSHPLLQQEPFTSIQYPTSVKRKILLNHTYHPNVCTKKKIIAYSLNPYEKLVIAYNSIREIKQIIYSLPERLQGECGILCSEHNKEAAGKFYQTIQPDGTLPQRIIFMTSAFFSGIDITDVCRLISVANIKYPFTLLSPNKLTQIAGRFRNGVISEEIIYNIKPYSNANIELYKTDILSRAENVAKLYNLADSFIAHDPRTERLFTRIKYGIIHQAYETLRDGTKIRLVRMTIDNHYQYAYFNIDALFDRYELEAKLYSHQNQLKNILAIQQHTQYSLEKNREGIDEKNASKTVREEIKVFKEQYRNDLKAFIFELKGQGNLDCFEMLTKEIAHSLPTILRKYLQRLYKLMWFMDLDQLITIKSVTGTQAAFRRINNAIIFWALSEDHPFKLAVLNTFRIGENYTSEYIAKKLNDIYLLFFGKSISEQEAVKEFRNLVKTTRNNNKGTYYKVKGVNPRKLSGTPKIKIETEYEIPLAGLWMLS